MAVRDLVLSQIIKRRGYGYELLADRLGEMFRLMDFSSASVYAALKSLERDGLVTVVGREVGPDPHASTARKVYEATPSGLAHNRAWMSARAGKAPLREELHMQMMVAEDHHIPDLLNGLDEVEEECEKQLAQLLAISFDGPAHARLSDFGAPLVRDGIAGHLQSTMEWVQRSRRGLRSRLGETPSGVPGRDRP